MNTILNSGESYVSITPLQPMTLFISSSDEKTQSELRLTANEYDMLMLMVDRDGECVYRDEILTKIWAGKFVSQGSINQLMSSLRTKMTKVILAKDIFITYPRKGYGVNPKYLMKSGSQTSERLSFSVRSLVQDVINNWQKLAAVFTLSLILTGAFLLDGKSTKAHFFGKWSSVGWLSIYQLDNTDNQVSDIAKQVAEKYMEAVPMSLLLTKVGDVINIDCIYHKPAWVRQRQFSLLIEKEGLAQEIVTRCNANGGYS